MADVNAPYHEQELHRYLMNFIENYHTLSDHFKSQHTFNTLGQMADTKALKELFLGRDQRLGVISKRTLVHQGCLYEHLAEVRDPIEVKEFAKAKNEFGYKDVQFQTTQTIPVVHFNYDHETIFSGKGIVTFKGYQANDSSFVITDITNVKRLSCGYLFHGKSQNGQLFFE